MNLNPLTMNTDRLLRLTHYLARRLMWQTIALRSVFGVPLKFYFKSFREFTRAWQYSKANKDPEIQSWVENYLMDGKVFYDIGANTGGYSVYVAKKYPSINVFAFEPNPVNVSAINRNAYINDLSNRISTFCLALSDKNRIDTFRFKDPGSLFYPGYAESTLDSRVHRTNDSRTAGGYSVLVASLSELIKTYNLPYPDHIKIDVDGHENEVVDGMTWLIENTPVKTILIELDEDETSVDSTLRRFGFRRVKLPTKVKAYRINKIENRLYLRG